MIHDVYLFDISIFLLLYSFNFYHNILKLYIPIERYVSNLVSISALSILSYYCILLSMIDRF